MRRLFSLGLLLASLLSGCATVGVETVAKLPPQTRIVALSLLGDTLAIRHVGTTVFQNEKLDFAVADWQIDAYAEAAARKQLQAGGKFIPVEGATSQARSAAGKMGTDFWTSRSGVQGGPGSLAALASQAQADYVLAIGPSNIGDPFMGTNQGFSGYGIYQRSAFGSQRAMNYLTMRVVLFDGKTGAEIARAQGYLSSGRSSSLWMDSKALAPPPVNAASTKTAIQALIDAVLRKAFTELKLNN